MSYTKQQLRDVIQLCEEVRDLAGETINEAETATRWDVEKRAFVQQPVWPYYGGTKTTGALRRKTLDLTRALPRMVP